MSNKIKIQSSWRTNVKFRGVILKDPIVGAGIENNLPLEEIIVELVDQKESMIKLITMLYNIAPRKITDEKGETVIWRCPDEMVPTQEELSS